jgi:hypothetical protein
MGRWPIISPTLIQHEDSVLFSEDPLVGLALSHIDAPYSYSYITRYAVKYDTPLRRVLVIIVAVEKQ